MMLKYQTTTVRKAFRLLSAYKRKWRWATKKISSNDVTLSTTALVRNYVRLLHGCSSKMTLNYVLRLITGNYVTSETPSLVEVHEQVQHRRRSVNVCSRGHDTSFTHCMQITVINYDQSWKRCNAAGSQWVLFTILIVIQSGQDCQGSASSCVNRVKSIGCCIPLLGICK